MAKQQVLFVDGKLWRVFVRQLPALLGMAGLLAGVYYLDSLYKGTLEESVVLTFLSVLMGGVALSYLLWLQLSYWLTKTYHAGGRLHFSGQYLTMIRLSVIYSMVWVIALIELFALTKVTSLSPQTINGIAALTLTLIRSSSLAWLVHAVLGWLASNLTDERGSALLSYHGRLSALFVRFFLGGTLLMTLRVWRVLQSEEIENFIYVMAYLPTFIADIAALLVGRLGISLALLIAVPLVVQRIVRYVVSCMQWQGQAVIYTARGRDIFRDGMIVTLGVFILMAVVMMMFRADTHFGYFWLGMLGWMPSYAYLRLIAYVEYAKRE
jgi:hypothetical protein